MIRLLWLFLLASFHTLASGYSDIPPAYREIALKHEVPVDIFYAIITRESNAKTNLGRMVPWPYSVNVAGKPYRFKDRRAMYQFCAELLAQGKTSFDIGPAQTNWKWQKQRFNEDLWLATDPYHSTSAGAAYLKELYDRFGDWWTAVGRYHNLNENIAKGYRDKVYEIWKRQQKQRHSF